MAVVVYDDPGPPPEVMRQPRSMLQGWLSGEPSVLVCEVAELTDFDATDVAAWLRSVVAGGVRSVTLGVDATADGAVEHHALLQFVRSLELAIDAEEPLPVAGLTLGALWAAMQRLTSRFGHREEQSCPPNVLVLRGFSQLADPSVLEWTELFRVASAWTHVLFVDTTLPQNPALVGAQQVRASVVAGPRDDAEDATREGSRNAEQVVSPTIELRRALRRAPGLGTPWALSARVRARVEAFAADPTAPLGPYTLRAAPIYAQHDEWPLALARVLVTPAWLARWCGHRDWPLGVTVSMRRYRSMLERACLEHGQLAELLPQIAGAALLEGIFLARLECPGDLTLPALEELRAAVVSALQQPLVGVGTAARPNFDGPLEELDDTTAIGALAAMLAFEPAGSSLAEQAVALQLRLGDDDTFVELSRVAAFLTDGQRARLILHRLGHEDLRRMLRPYGSLPSVAPLLTSFTDASVAGRTLAAVELALAEGIPLALSFA